MSDSRNRDNVTPGNDNGARASVERSRSKPFGRGRVRSWGQMLGAMATFALLGFDRVSAAQEPAAPAQDAAAAGSTQPLSLRYRFSEKYALAEDRAQPQSLVQYQVGSRETIRIETEKAAGAPNRQEVTYQTIYTERPAKIGRLGDATEMVRRYDAFRVQGLRQNEPRLAALFHDLRLWYQFRAGAAPQLISLTPNRPIKQEEYDNVLDQIFLPRLSVILPPRPVRVDDTWPISRAAAQALLGKVPEAGDFQLEGRLLSVSKVAEGSALSASIDISGKLVLADGDGAVRARVTFLFEPIPTAPAVQTGQSAKSATARDAGVVDAKGYISRVHMIRQQSVPIDKNGRLEELRTRDLLMQRRLSPGQAAAEADLTVTQQPVADEKNSWLLFDDPHGLYHLLHPQEFALDVFPSGELQLVYHHANVTTDFLRIVPIHDAARDRSRSDPQVFVRDLKATWAQQGHQLVDGPVGWLPDQNWEPLKRRVFHLETAMKPDPRAAAKRGAARFYLDAYMVVFNRGDVFYVYATTDRDDQVAFREQVEKLIRTIELGPSEPGVAGPALQPSPTRPSATAPTPGRPAPPPGSPPDRTPGRTP
jgi:hypothetical protein